MLNIKNVSKIKNKFSLDKYLNNIENSIQFDKITKYFEYLKSANRTSTNCKKRNQKICKSSLIKIKKGLPFYNRNNFVSQGQRKSENPLLRNELLRTQYKQSNSNSHLNKILQKISSEYNHFSSQVNKYNNIKAKSNLNKAKSVSFNYNKFTKNNTSTNISLNKKLFNSFYQGRRKKRKNIQLATKFYNQKKENIVKKNLDLIFDCILFGGNEEN